jgi:hypothetical protein
MRTSTKNIKKIILKCAQMIAIWKTIRIEIKRGDSVGLSFFVFGEV